MLAGVMEDSPSVDLADRATDIMRATQSLVCDAVEAVESMAGGGGRFVEQTWQGQRCHGTTRVLSEGVVFERVGTVVSVAHGKLSAGLASVLPGDGPRFDATRVGVALYPRNPHAPAAHAAFWFVGRGSRRWVGGGSELVPYYPADEDIERVHHGWREHCEAFSTVADPRRFREWAEAWFHLPHRGERRGMAGIFFDHLRVDPGRLGHADTLLRFVAEAGIRFIDVYTSIVEARAATPSTPAEREWQRLRRGRDVEFALMCDRDPVFGPRAGEYAEPIAALLPPEVRWASHDEPLPGEAERALLDALRRPVPPLRLFEP